MEMAAAAAAGAAAAWSRLAAGRGEGASCGMVGGDTGSYFWAAVEQPLGIKGKLRPPLSFSASLVTVMHTTVILYNYYHRKMFPQLAFVDAKRFCMCSVSAGKALLGYFTLVHEYGDNSGKEVRLSAADISAVQACEIAAELDASKASPDMDMWEISKIAVLLLDPTRKKCLVEYGAITKGVYSIIEKELDAAAGISHTTSQPEGLKSANKRTFHTFDQAYFLQQLAFSEVESRTGLKSSDLHVLGENFAYSLSKKRTATKLLIVEYKQTMNVNFVEISLQELISSMTGPVFVNDPYPNTTSVVEYYHILPYKEILFELLHRNWPADSALNEQALRHGLHPVRDEILEEQGVKSTLKMQKQITKVSTPEQNKRALKATGANSNQNPSTRKQKKSNKRKIEASRATAADGPDDGTAAPSRGPLALEYGVEVENKKTKKSTCSNMPQDGFPTQAPCVSTVMKNGALEPRNMDLTEKSGGVPENNIDQVYDSLRSVQKIWDEMAPCVSTVMKNGDLEPQNMEAMEKTGGATENNVDQVYDSVRSVQKIQDEMAPCVSTVMKNGALEPQNMEATEKPGGATENNVDQVYDSLRSVQKIQDEMAPCVSTVMKNGALEHQNMEATEKPGGATENNVDQVYDSLRSVPKIQDEMAPCVSTVMKNGALEPQNMEATEKPAGATENNVDQVYDSLRSVQKIQDEMAPCVSTVMKNGALEPQNMEGTEKPGGATENNVDQVYDSLRSVQKIQVEMAPCVSTVMKNGALEPQNMEATEKPAGATENNVDQVYDSLRSVQKIQDEMALCVGTVMNNGALEPQNMEVTEKSGGVTENNVDQVYGSLRPVQKIRVEMLHKERIFQERGAQCDMDIQTVLNEGKITPKVLSITYTYKEPCSNMLEIANSPCTGNGVQTMRIEKKTLREALHIRNKCQELDEICIESYWIPPRYTIDTSVADGRFHAIVHLKGPDFEISTTGYPRRTPREAMCSAAFNMITELHRKGVEEEKQDN